MSGYEALRWELLEQIDPWGPKRADYRAAVLTFVMACCFSGKRKPKFKKFLQMFDFGDKHEQTDEEIEQIFNQIAGK